MKYHILIVEDELSIATLIQYNLQQAGYETTVVYNGKAALQEIEQKNFDFLVLDLMLPKISGMEVCKTIRNSQNSIPILMLTAKSDEHSKVNGLQSGADDYLTKPFSPRELIARIEAILRRSPSINRFSLNEKTIKINKLTLYPNSFRAELNKEPLQLTKKEFELLVYLAQNKGKVVSREELLYSVWGFHYAGDTRTVDMQVSRLRDKIEDDSKNPRYIKTIWGVGYTLEESDDSILS